MKYGIRYHDKRWWVYEVAQNRIVLGPYIFRFVAQSASDGGYHAMWDLISLGVLLGRRPLQPVQ